MHMHDITEFARRLGVSRRLVEMMLARGDLPPPVRFGRARRWSDATIDQFITERSAAAAGDQHRGPGRPRAETK